MNATSYMNVVFSNKAFMKMRALQWFYSGDQIVARVLLKHIDSPFPNAYINRVDGASAPWETGGTNQTRVTIQDSTCAISASNHPL